MGSGKTTVGKILAEKLALPFMDLDEEIEKSENLSIPEIFNSRGEIYFRKLENKILKEILISQESFVLAVGGGTPCYGDAIKIMKESPNAIVIYLRTPIGILAKRLFSQKSLRPLISHLKTFEDLTEFVGIHVFERSSFYSRAHFIIDTADDEPVSVAEKIKKIIVD